MTDFRANCMKTTIRFLAVTLGFTVSFSLWAQAVPSLINYQGQLLAPNGTPIATGDYDVEISLYPVESGGALIWGPEVFNGESGTGHRPKVSAFEGRFNLVLGPEDTEDRDLAEIVAANPSLFLEIKVGSGNPIAPRQQLLTAPYALSAASAVNATKLNGQDWGALFANGDPANGNLGVGVAPSEVRADFNGRMRVRQANDGSSGIWFQQNGVGDRAFVGMLDNNIVGFYTVAGAGWALRVDNITGDTTVLGLNIGPAHLSAYEGTLFGERFNSFFVSNVDNSYFEGDVWANGIKLTSDERLKENIETIDDPLSKIRAIRGVRFNFKAGAPRSHLDPHRRRAGVLAQEVQQVLPEVVTAAPDGYLAVDYEGLVPVLIEAVKEQQRQIEALKAEMASLKADHF